MVTGVKKRIEHDFQVSRMGVLLRGGAVTWKIEEVSCLVAGGAEPITLALKDFSTRRWPK